MNPQKRQIRDTLGTRCARTPVHIGFLTDYPLDHRPLTQLERLNRVNSKSLVATKRHARHTTATRKPVDLIDRHLPAISELLRSQKLPALGAVQSVLAHDAPPNRVTPTTTHRREDTNALSVVAGRAMSRALLTRSPVPGIRRGAASRVAPRRRLRLRSRLACLVVSPL
jgi:hypothetical protein